MSSRGYLGKISAVVTANTSDLSRKLSGGKKEVESFARSVQSTISSANSAAGRSFNEIFTPLQKLQRALAAASSNALDLKTSEAINQIKQLVSASEQLAKPLGAAAKQLSSLSLDVQGEFISALVSAQRHVVEVRDEIERTGKATEESFTRAAASVERIVAASARLGEAGSAVSRLADGTELRFRQPAFLAEVNRSASLQQQAAALPADRIQGSAIGSLVGQQSRAAAEAERLLAALERIRITRDGDETQARAAYTRQLEALRRVNQELEREIGIIRAVASAEASRAQDAQRQIAANDRLISQERELYQQRLESARQSRDTARSQITAAANVLDGPRRSSEASIEDVRAGLESRAVRFRSAVDSTFGLSQYGELRQQLQRVAAELRSIEAETNRLRELDPQQDIARYAEEWARVETRTRQVNDFMAQGIRLAEQATAEARSRAEQEERIRAAGERQFRPIPGNPTGPFGPFPLADFPTTPGNPTGPFGPLPSDVTRLPPFYLQNRTAADARNSLGQDIEDPTRMLGGLQSAVTSVQGQIAALPAPIRAELLPALRESEQQFIRLSSSGRATAEQIENARNQVERLSRSARLASQALTIPSFADFAENSNIRRATAELEALGRILVRVGAEAGGPAAAAYDRLRQRTQEAIRTGTIGLPQVRRELELLQREAAEAAAQTGRISVGRAVREIARSGDVARGAFGNAGLAIQQAAFAFEDFFSVTGGIDQRIRAAGNNISQLGFIIGGTWGLAAGIIAAVGAQGVAALVNWYNEGIRAEDQVKALNDALARQKSLVEELAQAFATLGDSIARRAFSAPAQEARAFGKELEAIEKKQRQLIEQRAGDLDPTVQRERARQASLQDQLSRSQDPGQRVALVRQIQESRDRERAATTAAASRTVSGNDVARELRDTILSLIPNIPSAETSGAAEAVRRRAREVAASVDRGDTPEAIRQQRAVVEAEIARLTPRAAQGDQAASQAVARLTALLTSLELPLTKAIDSLTVQIVSAAQGAAISIENAQQDVADAIRRGVEGAAAFRDALDNTAKQLDDAFRQLDNASNITDQGQREVEVRRAEGAVNDILMRRDAIAERAREMRLGRTFGGERTTAALSSLQGNDRFRNEMAGMTAVVAAAADREEEARRKLDEAKQDAVAAEKRNNAALIATTQERLAAAREELEAAQKAGEAAALMAEAAIAMEESLSRLRNIVNDAVSQSESIANDGQQRLNQDPTDENRRFRNRAERDLISDRERAARAQNAIDERRRAAGSDPRIAAINAEIAAIDQQRKQMEADAKINNTQADPRQMQELANREAALAAERERILLELTAAERDQADAINQEISARRKLIDQQLREAQLQRDFEDNLSNRRNPLGDAMRGTDLVLTEQQKADEAIRQGLADIAAYFGRLAEATNGLVDQQAQREAQNRFLNDQANAAAPMLVEFANEVRNAMAQGPSRAALTATDSSTLEGQKELNRLLRGDDPSRNIDMVELQRQANEYLRIIAQKDGAQVAN